MKRGRMQSKDIPDRRVLSAVRTLAFADGDGQSHWVMAWDLEKVLGLEGQSKDRLFRAKCEALIRRKLLEGCTCGCRGDYELTVAGDALLDAHCNIHDDCLRHDGLARACLERTSEKESDSR